MQTFPRDTLTDIFKHLTALERFRLKGVCTRFRDLIKPMEQASTLTVRNIVFTGMTMNGIPYGKWTTIRSNSNSVYEAYFYDDHQVIKGRVGISVYLTWIPGPYSRERSTDVSIYYELRESDSCKELVFTEYSGDGDFSYVTAPNSNASMTSGWYEHYTTEDHSEVMDYFSGKYGLAVLHTITNTDTLARSMYLYYQGELIYTENVKNGYNGLVYPLEGYTLSPDIQDSLQRIQVHSWSFYKTFVERYVEALEFIE